MNRLNYEILEGIDAINDAELESGMKVLESVIRAYEKADMILENASESADLSSYAIFQEGALFQEADDAETKSDEKSDSDDKANTGFRRINKKTGKKENILKSILLAIPRAIKMFINWLKKKFTKKKENDINRAIDNVEKAVESGELEKHADIIMEELATTPAEKAEIKKETGKKKSKKSNAQAVMGSIETPKNTTPEKKKDSNANVLPSSIDVAAGIRAGADFFGVAIDDSWDGWSIIPEKIQFVDEDPMAVLKRHRENLEEKIEKYEAECLIKNGKIFISEAFIRNAEKVPLIVELFKELSEMSNDLASIQPDESKESIVSKVFETLYVKHDFHKFEDKQFMNDEGITKNRNHKASQLVTISDFRSMYEELLKNTKLIYNDGNRAEVLINKFMLVFSEFLRTVPSDREKRTDFDDNVQRCANKLSNIHKYIGRSIKYMTYFVSDFDYYTRAFVKIDEAFAKAVRKYRVFHDSVTGGSTRVAMKRNEPSRAYALALKESKEKGNNAVATYERKMAEYRQDDAEDASLNRKRYEKETKNMSPEERRKWAEREYRESYSDSREDYDTIFSE